MYFVKRGANQVAGVLATFARNHFTNYSILASSNQTFNVLLPHSLYID